LGQREASMATSPRIVLPEMVMLVVASRPTPSSPIEAGVVSRLVVVAGRLRWDR